MMMPCLANSRTVRTLVGQAFRRPGPSPPAATSSAQGRRGSSLVEFALMTPLLFALLAGVLDYGQALSKATAVANAARIGAEFASSSTANTTNTAGIQSAAINSAPSFTGLTVSSAQSCECPGGATVSCGGSCSNGKMLMYVTVTVQATSSSIFSYTGLPFTGNVSTQVTMRAQ